jgi:adenosylcobinamide-phosphate synthase
MITCLAALLIDTLIGDPRTRLHPVALIGRLIGFLDRLFYTSRTRPIRQMMAGLVVVLLVLLVVFNVLYLLYWGLDALGIPMSRREQRHCS